MKVILNQVIELENFREGYARITKTFESNVIPHKGDIIVDSVWKADDEQVVESVSINYHDNECHVDLPKVVLPSNDKAVLDEYLEMTELHGWESPIKI
ncbi:TPA: hypothetical protein QCQ90_002169 [Bacillus cereus]|nr:hypothetical protein [Bacillus cereus]HDR4620441.1 hypothetical protein [Bacillus cereus]